LDKIYFKKGINDLLPESIVWERIWFWIPDRIWLSKYNDQMIKEIKNSNVLNYYCDMDVLQVNINQCHWKINGCI
jgi:hypothetical protein